MGGTPTFREALRFWLKLGLISFGGPAGQIAIMHTELVEKKKWISEQHFLHALNYCMLLPGPEATQLATYCGWLLHRTWGGIAAGVLFVLPSAAILWALSWAYAAYGTLPGAAAVFHGLKPAVTAIVAAALIRIARRTLKNAASWVIAAAAFVALAWLRAPFPAVMAAAAATGWALGRLRPGLLPDATAQDIEKSDTSDTPVHTAPGWGRAARVLAVSLALWWAPVVAAGLVQGWDGPLAQMGLLFSRAAMVTFGGAYAVLPYVAQHAVEHHHWLTAAQMLDGFGLAETTPGPLIIVLQFTGFLGGWNHPGAMSPLLAGTLGAAMTTWTTFVPCFLWIFLGAPHIERMRGHTGIGHALAAVTASVVGVILSLTVWFARHVFWPGDTGTDWFAVAVCAAGFLALQRFRAGLVPVILVSAALGLVYGRLVSG